MSSLIRQNTPGSISPVLRPQTFDQLIRFSEMAASSDLMPKDYKGKPANVMIAVQMGSELGLSPMQAIQNISVINGRPSVWGDAMLGLIQRDARCSDVLESISQEGDARTATCTIKRQDRSATTRTFSVADAKKAGLWGKQGPWQQYPDRMLAMRARGFAARDAFPDVLRGLISTEEAEDSPPTEKFTGTTINAQTEHVRQPKPTQSTKIHDVEPEKPRADQNTAAREFAEKIIKNMDRASNAEKLVVWLSDAQNNKDRSDIMAFNVDLGHALESAIKAACERLGLKTHTPGQDDFISSVRLSKEMDIAPDADIPSLDDSFPGDRIAAEFAKQEA